MTAQGRILGGIGVTSGTPEQDEMIASSGVQVVLEYLARETSDGRLGQTSN